MTKSSEQPNEKTKRSDFELLAEISHKLDMVVASIAALDKDRDLQIERLSDRFEPIEMADILGATPNAMRVRLFQLKKGKGGKKARKKES
jgi:hypothetical protein